MADERGGGLGEGQCCWLHLILVCPCEKMTLLGSGCVYTHVAPTHKMEIFCFSFPSVSASSVSISSLSLLRVQAASEQWPFCYNDVNRYPLKMYLILSD